MALRRVALAAAALSMAALAGWAGGLGPAKVPEAVGIRSMTVDAPFQAPEPTAEVDAATVPGATAAGSIDGAASRDTLIGVLALVAILGFGAGIATLRAEAYAGSSRLQAQPARQRTRR